MSMVPYEAYRVVTIGERNNRSRCEQCLEEACIPYHLIRQDQPGYLPVYVTEPYLDMALTALRRAYFTVVHLPS